MQYGGVGGGGVTIKCRSEEKIRVLFSVNAPISPPFTIYLHNFTFQLVARGTEERGKTARGLYAIYPLPNLKYCSTFPCPFI